MITVDSNKLTIDIPFRLTREEIKIIEEELTQIIGLISIGRDVRGRGTPGLVDSHHPIPAKTDQPRPHTAACVRS